MLLLVTIAMTGHDQMHRDQLEADPPRIRIRIPFPSQRPRIILLVEMLLLVPARVHVPVPYSHPLTIILQRPYVSQTHSMRSS